MGVRVHGLPPAAARCLVSNLQVGVTDLVRGVATTDYASQADVPPPLTPRYGRTRRFPTPGLGYEYPVRHNRLRRTFKFLNLIDEHRCLSLAIRVDQRCKLNDL